MRFTRTEKWLPMIGGIGGVLFIFFVGFIVFFHSSWRALDSSGHSIPPEQAMEVKLYFFDAQSRKEIIQTFRIHKDAPLRDQIKQIIDYMTEKPKNTGRKSLWPLSLPVRSVYLRKNGLLILDFEKSVQYNQSSAFTELLAVRSIIRTLTSNFNDVQQVKFLVGGQEVETLAGHVDIFRPLRIEDVSE